MILRWIGALLIVGGCGGIGFSLARSYKREERELRQLLKAIDIFACELEFRRSPLPNVCRSVSNTIGGSVGSLFSVLAEKLEQQICPDAGCCMADALQEVRELPTLCSHYAAQLGQTLGIFDAAGQLKELEATKKDCMVALDILRAEGKDRIRSYQTLGLCAGAALAILLI